MRKELYTRSDLLGQLEALGAPKGGIVLVHSALRTVGCVEGRGEGVLDALVEYFTAEGGLLCIPTHTWGFFDREITLDMIEPDTCLGALSRIALADPRGIRSENPTHSMVVFGDPERAERFVEGELDMPTGTHPDSCYGKIYREGGSILLLGVSHNRNTYLHCVDEIIGVPNRLGEPRPVRIRRKSGEIAERLIRGHANSYGIDISLRFPKYETAFRYYGCIRDGYFGDAPIQLCDAVGMKEVMERIMLSGDRSDPLGDELVIPPQRYVR